VVLILFIIVNIYIHNYLILFKLLILIKINNIKYILHVNNINNNSDPSRIQIADISNTKGI